MEKLKRRSDKNSLPLKFVALLACLIAIAALILSIYLEKKNKREFPQLILSPTLPKPESTIKGGFYSSHFDLSFEKPSSAIRIYYTTDGSKPGLGSLLYSRPFRIEDQTKQRNKLSVIPTSPRWKPPIGNVQKGVLVRAIAVDEKNRKSAEFVRTFFVSEDKRSLNTLPVIALSVNEKDLFGYNQGIYVLGKSYVDKDNYIRKRLPLSLPWWEYPSNYLWRGSDSERKAYIEFFESRKDAGFEANVGIRINGNATRGFAQKSLRVCFREEYGKSELYYDLFETGQHGKFNSFILRNSGNDWNKTMFRDAFMHQLMKDTHVDIQNYRPVVVFINAEYWGIHNIRERFDENYLANKYRMNRDSIIILELSGKVDHGHKEDEEDFLKLLDFVKYNDLSVKKNYYDVLEKIDIKSLTDFIIANVYFCNSDWPNNNVKFWRHRTIPGSGIEGPQDGRWRWMLYDTDWGFGYNSMSSPDSDLLKRASSVGSIGILFSALLKNSDFRKEFLERFQYMLNNRFRTADCIRKIDLFKDQIAPEMPEHIERWRAIEGYSQWLLNIEVMKNFAARRPQAQADQLNAFFQLKGSRQISIEK